MSSHVLWPKTSTSASSCKGREIPGLGYVQEGKGGPFAEQELVAGRLEADGVLKVGPRESWFGQLVAEERERETE